MDRKISVQGKFDYFEYLVNKIRGLDGSIVELGVGAAKSAKFICKALKSQKTIREYWGFDSFQGFPQPTQEDLTSTKKELKKGYFAKHWCHSQNEAIKKITNFCSYPKNHLHLVKGYFSKKLFLKYDKSPIVLLHLDCDLYESYNISLNFFYNYVSYGGIIAFDEYIDPVNLKEWPGASIAINKWLKTTKYTKSDLFEVNWNTIEGRCVHKYFLHKI